MANDSSYLSTHLRTFLEEFFGTETVFKLDLKADMKFGATVNKLHKDVSSINETKEGIRYELALKTFVLDKKVVDVYTVAENILTTIDATSSPSLGDIIDIIIGIAFPDVKIDETAKYCRFAFSLNDETPKSWADGIIFTALFD